MIQSIYPTFPDKELVCCDCGQTFVFGEGEQRYFYSKKLSPPKRCQDCRRERRLSIIPAPEVMRHES